MNSVEKNRCNKKNQNMTEYFTINRKISEIIMKMSVIPI